MAQVQDRKRDIYSHKQSVREEALVPAYLESAGDVLLKELSKKQLDTQTTLEDQLKVTQNFEKAFDLSPESRMGIATLEEVQKELKDAEPEKNDFSPEKGEETQNLRVLLKQAGLSRHEVDLTLCEKPNSSISKLYMFALGNKKQEGRKESADRLLPNHPIHHLVDIHEEYFGHLKRVESKSEGETSGRDNNIPLEGRPIRKKKKHRKRRKKNSNALDIKAEAEAETEPSMSKTPILENSESNVDEQEMKLVRPSLWDVQDMKKWCEKKKEYGCNQRTMYAIKDGKIYKLDDLNKDDVT